MKVNSQQVFDKLMFLYGLDSLGKISIKFNKNRAWGGQMIKNDSIPYPQCVQACEEKNVSMDWLLFGKDEDPDTKPVSQKEFVNNLKESFYECWELKLLPNYPKEEMPVISTLFVKNFKNIIKIEMNSEDIERTKKLI